MNAVRRVSLRHRASRRVNRGRWRWPHGFSTARLDRSALTLRVAGTFEVPQPWSPSAPGYPPLPWPGALDAARGVGLEAPLQSAARVRVVIQSRY